MSAYQKFRELNIDYATIGLDQNISDVNYFCTPIGAKVIADAGVDGIRYCFIKGFDEMIFAISPSDLWYIPAVNFCSKGMVVDFCIEVEPEAIEKFINKWNLYEEDKRDYSNAEYEQIQEEHPLNMDFHSKLSVNDTDLRQAQGCCVYWIPKKCMPDIQVKLI